MELRLLHGVAITSLEPLQGQFQETLSHDYRLCEIKVAYRVKYYNGNKISFYPSRLT